MTEKPLVKLVRLLGGASMLPGPLGYKVLGQLLISGSKGTEVAGASVVLAGVSRQTNAAVQVAVRSMAPAVVIEALSRKEQRRLEELNAEMRELMQELEARYGEVCDDSTEIGADRREGKSAQSLDDALLREVLELRRKDTPTEREVRALRYVLGECVSASITNKPKRLNAGPSEATAETQTGKKETTKKK